MLQVKCRSTQIRTAPVSFAAVCEGGTWSTDTIHLYVVQLIRSKYIYWFTLQHTICIQLPTGSAVFVPEKGFRLNSVKESLKIDLNPSVILNRIATCHSLYRGLKKNGGKQSALINEGQLQQKGKDNINNLRLNLLMDSILFPPHAPHQCGTAGADRHPLILVVLIPERGDNPLSMSHCFGLLLPKTSELEIPNTWWICMGSSSGMAQKEGGLRVVKNIGADENINCM